MNIVVTTPTGKIGSKLTDLLLRAGQTPTVIARHPEKVTSLAKRGAKVAEGSLLDPAFLTRTTQGAEVLFWVTPPDVASTNFRAHQNKAGAAVAEAIRANRIPRVVNLSSLGAHLGKGAGPVNGLHDVEKKLDLVSENITHLRPTAFMENTLAFVPMLKSGHSLFQPLSGATRYPLIATRDIAAEAARVVLDATWSGRRVITLFGPAEHSQDEIAGILSRVLERTITHVQVPAQAFLDSLRQAGVSDDVASQYLELYQAFEGGRLFEGLASREPDVRGPTPYEQFAREVLRPLLPA